MISSMPGIVPCGYASGWPKYPVGVPEGGLALNFVRDVLVGEEGSWQMYVVPNVQQDNVLAMLTLLHLHVRCVVEPYDGDDDYIVKEVSSASAHVALLSSGAGS